VDARKSNAVLSLWDDPDFAPLRSSFIESIAASEKDEAKKQLARQSFSDFATLMENPFVIGYLRSPAPQKLSHSQNGMGYFSSTTARAKKLCLPKPFSLCVRKARKFPSSRQLPLLKSRAENRKKNGETYWAENRQIRGWRQRSFRFRTNSPGSR